MFGGNFQTWKLHSAQDYFMFFAYILAGVLVFWLIAKHMNKQRNHEKAVEKVLEDNIRTIDIMSDGMTLVGCKEMGNEIVKRI